MINKRNKQAILIGFLSLIILPTILYKFIPKEYKKNNENRALSQRPELTIDNYDTYPKLYEEYYNDTLPFKNFLTNLNSKVKYNIFDISPSNAVIKGKDNWLFYDSKNKNDGDTLADFQRTNYYSEEMLGKFKKSLEAKKKFLDDLGIEFYVYIASNKEEIYPEYMPDEYVRLKEKSKADIVVDYLNENTDVNIIYPKDILMSYKDNYDLYHKLDTHWNKQGAYIGFTELMKAMGREYENIENLNIEANEISTGDLANMINMSGDLKDIEYNVNYKKDIKLELIEDKGKLMNRYGTNNENGKKLLTYRDSFWVNMAPFLAREFEESAFVWGIPFNEAQIKKEQPDVVILEVVERNLEYLTE